ncbi:MAG TPA: DUF1232 domain-containing protein [Anaerolineae bacterium]
MRGNRRSPSFWTSLIRQLRLAWRLLRDSRVPIVPKLLPLAVLAYILSPIDLLPDLALGLGQLDDLGLFILGLQVFPLICPPEVVRAILEEMEGNVIEGEWRRSDSDPPSRSHLPKSDH